MIERVMAELQVLHVNGTSKKMKQTPIKGTSVEMHSYFTIFLYGLATDSFSRTGHSKRRVICVLYIWRSRVGCEDYYEMRI